MQNDDEDDCDYDGDDVDDDDDYETKQTVHQLQCWCLVRLITGHIEAARFRYQNTCLIQKIL